MSQNDVGLKNSCDRSDNVIDFVIKFAGLIPNKIVSIFLTLSLFILFLLISKE